MESDVSELKPGTVHTVQTLAAAEPGFNEGGIRWTIFQHKSKLVDAGAIFYVGKKLLIDRDRYVNFLRDGRVPEPTESRTPCEFTRTP